MDLVKQLRNMTGNYNSDLFEEAADEIERLLERLGAWELRAQTEARLRIEAESKLEERTKQLPEGMEHCTIQFKECEQGHGRLTATNWIDNGCPWCRLDKLQRLAWDWRRTEISDGEFACAVAAEFREPPK